MIYAPLALLLFVLSPACANASALTGESEPANGYLLVTPAMTNKNRAALLLKKMRGELPEAVIEGKKQEREFYRLVVQCFSRLAPARKLQSDLQGVSKSVFVVPAEHSYCVVASSHIDKNAALAEQKQLAKKNVRTDLVKTSIAMPHWQIKCGDFANLRDAVFKADSISQKGFVTIIEPPESTAKPLQKEASFHSR